MEADGRKRGCHSLFWLRDGCWKGSVFGLKGVVRGKMSLGGDGRCLASLPRVSGRGVLRVGRGGLGGGEGGTCWSREHWAGESGFLLAGS